MPIATGVRDLSFSLAAPNDIDAPVSRPSPPPIVVGRGEGVTMFAKNTPLVCIKQLPLPGIVIFVHGVNSEGEWFDASEEGLCRGLNQRLGRLDDQMMYRGVDAGQLMPAKYTESVTPDGFLNPDLLADNFTPSRLSSGHRRS
ncbi:hypothetical protein WI41_07790 [Burkholderia latens]|uniref:T6SS Tle3 phospholipase effector alpha/beta domain-containing protein n=1 Tax=Burkholderia latens TaxID=488446 RepID=A0AAP1GAN4_9BURK|nr:hypothetical protein WI41_07790 [Burkholderia latens]